MRGHPANDSAAHGNEALKSPPWEPGAPTNGRAWSTYTTALWALTTCWITFVSTIYSAGTAQISQEFHVSYDVANTGTSLLIFGFAPSPMLWAPLCEVYGRKRPALAVHSPHPSRLCAAFASGTRTAKDIQTILITRFFAGVFGSSPISITGGSIVDIWTPAARNAYGIAMMAQFALDALWPDESHAGVFLIRKAHRLRRTTGNFALQAQWEETSPTFRDLSNYLVRPFQMLFDPICLLLTIYILESSALEYGQIQGWDPVVSQLPFLALLFGCLVAAVANIYDNVYYGKKLVANNFKPVPKRNCRLGCMVAPFSLRSPFQYLVDNFTHFSASAIAANTFVRSMAAGVFPLFVWPMYEKIGIDWGSTIFAFVSVLLLPAPFLFFKWGNRIRARGEFSKLSIY
ncbi:hypothetical protein DL765_008582 [Monosporascus sp. GIB2]|nr:hypothetical protein DL765_008582 [Monosporascus sp. GIB2]